jgi:mannosyl-oligosaccharide alpha-1,2-mannosidase
MGLHEEFERAHAWIAENMTFDRKEPQTISFFETTIRCLGGLLAAHDLTGSKLFLEKAEDLGRRIAPVFQGSPTGILTNNAGLPHTGIIIADDTVALAELGSNLIEFGTLGRRTGNATYRLLAEDSMRFIHAKHPLQPLLGTTIQRNTGRISDEQLTIAAPVDSYFEYLLKYWILGGKQDDHWRDRWINATDMALDVLQVRTQQGGFAFTGDIPYKGSPPTHVVTHLGCFYPGNVALGVISGAATGERAARYLEFAEKMMHTCFQLYNVTKTGLGADNAEMNVTSGELSITGPNYLQRPEVVESLFYLWRATHNEKYRDWGWFILQAIEKHCRKEAGYSGVYNVDQIPVESDNVQQSWFLAETLKYLFLLFSDDSVIPLDKWVFNTEAHPVRANLVEEESFVDWDWLLK